MRKIKCGMDGAEICCGMVCKVRKVGRLSLAALQCRDHPHVSPMSPDARTHIQYIHTFAILIVT